MNLSEKPIAKHPTWENQIKFLFSAPYWISPEQDRLSIGQRWMGCMSGYQIDLNQYDSVKQWAVLIYHQLYSRSMPLTIDERQYWPDEALETFREWINQGYRHTDTDPITTGEILPKPENGPVSLSIRRDIRSLSQAELDNYRKRLDDLFQVWNDDPQSPGQQFFAVHGNWCLHYQEAFIFWHRAYLMRFEQVIGCAVPYWNWYAEDAAVEGSPNAGIPQAFIDLTYIHPLTGEERPNPLRFAVAWNGRSKACQNNFPPGTDCRFVQRDPLLYPEGEKQPEARRKKIEMAAIFQEQVAKALTWPCFSQPEGSPGYPWANILTFNPPQPDNLYPNRTDFDGLYEQPHDNWHGWVGPDMADNAYTAFDPIFWSYHANIDRIFEIWLRAHPAATYTAGFPIHPFFGPLAQCFEFDDPRAFVYTTIGDLAKDSRGLGYDYAAPVTPDYRSVQIGTVATSARPSRDRRERGLYVVFDGVRCTQSSYFIDVFLNQPNPAIDDVDARNPHYAGRFSRIGMGLEDDKGRCIKQGVTRILDATSTSHRLGLTPDDPCQASLLVTDAHTGRVLSPEEYRPLPGFEGQLVWGEPWPYSQEAKSSAPSCPHHAASVCPAHTP